MATPSVSKQIKKMDFSLDPDSVDPAKKTGALLNYEEIDALKNVRINNGLIEALQADIHAIHEAGSKKYGVMLQPRTLTYTLNLNVVRTGSGNISLSIVPTTPSIKNIAPKPQVTRTDTTTNELIVILSTSFPTPTAQSQPVQFFYEVHGDTGSAWIQSPYTQKELQKVIGKKFFALGPREKLTPKQVEQVNPFIDDKKRNDFNALMAPNGTNPPQVKDDNKNGKPPPPAGRGIPRSLLDPRSF